MANLSKLQKAQKAKEFVTLRYRELTNGNKSLYLDIYRDGTRSREFLRLYLIPERTPFDKLANQETMRAATAIKSERATQIINGTAGIKRSTSNVLLLDYMKVRTKRLRERAIKDGRVKQSSARLNDFAAAKLEDFIKKTYGSKAIKLTDVDKAFCVRFGEYLCTCSRRGTKQPHPLTSRSRHYYFEELQAALNSAKKDGLIMQNPTELIDKVELLGKKETGVKAFLSAEEVRQLMDTEYKQPNVTRAFLFSCFCGLRWSDIVTLKWGELQRVNGETIIKKKMVKTQGMLYLPLSGIAKEYLPERGDKTDNDNVFSLPAPSSADGIIYRWAKVAGINKHISFHTARHTFATLMLTEGADIYTSSKLLGHTNIKTTQIYAKIVDAKKAEAVSRLDNIFKK